MKVVHYPYLMQLMAKYGLNKCDIAKIIGKSYRQTIKKLNKETSKLGKETTFDIEEAAKIVSFFKEKGEEVSVDIIFFNGMVSNENKTA
jgi:3-keto-L-gulonate-6-phosphate decarboxylase